MNQQDKETTTTTFFGGRYGTLIGAVLIAHFAILCLIKQSRGEADSVWWLSYVMLALD